MSRSFGGSLRAVAATILAAVAMLSSGLATSAAAAQERPPATAQQDCSVHGDGRLWCGNRSGAKLYFQPSYGAPQTGIMDTTYSWFTCFVHGDPHPGGNDVWYLTKGDEALNGFDGWGYMPAVDVSTDIDPAPGLAAC